MKTIWKFPLRIDDEQYIDMPRGSKMLSVQLQGNEPYLWAEVDDSYPVEPHLVVMMGTGHPKSHKADRFVDIFQMAGGSLVFHVYQGV